MCGIVGVVGGENVAPIIVSGLQKLEYRGYDSAGIGLFNKDNFLVIKEEGKIKKLEAALKGKAVKSNIGIGHTRWATHGCPSKENAHPHLSNLVCVVHNGIIENYQEIKAKLQKNGVEFLSQTDTEVIPHLIEYHLKKHSSIKQALIAACKEVQGSFAFAIMFKDQKDLIAVAKRGSPILLGVGENKNYIASDYYALSDYTQKVVYLEDDEFALVRSDGYEIFDIHGVVLQKPVQLMEETKSQISKEGFEHFMLKEIYEQPRVMQNIAQTYLDLNQHQIHLPNFPFDLQKINKITIVACGTSYYAGLCAKYLIEEIAAVEVEVDIASEFRYRAHPFRDDNLMLFISQSGETADTIAALKYAKTNKQKILSLVNVPQSSMAQLSDAIIRTVAGPEIGVASTKAYTAQVAVLALFAIQLAFVKEKIDVTQKNALIQEFADSIHKMIWLFESRNISNIRKIAGKLYKSENAIYIGRSISQVTAFEAALKLRELSYINTQGIAAGELKHGTIALIDKKMPAIVIAPNSKSKRNQLNHLFEKTLSNAEEVKARGGQIVFISDSEGIERCGEDLARYNIEIPQISGSIQEAIIPVIVTQLLAYYIALYLGNDVDQPRNLAKSVTVE